MSDLLKGIAAHHAINLNERAVIVFGEWAGGNIQKGMAISGLPLMWIVFDACSIQIPVTDATSTVVAAEPAATAGKKKNGGKNNKKKSAPKSEAEGEGERADDDQPDLLDTKWIDVSSVIKNGAPSSVYSAPHASVYNVGQFECFSVKVDFSDLQTARSKLVEITDRVEQECPVGMHFGKRGTGEGVVWRTTIEYTTLEGVPATKVLRFKVKGQEHSTAAHNKMAAIEPEKAASLSDFVSKSCTENRMRQGVQQLFADETPTSLWLRKSKTFAEWVVADVLKEDMDSFPFPGDDALKKQAVNAITARSHKWFETFVNVG